MIGFTGPYSDVNFGDYAMLVNNLLAMDVQEATLFVYDRPFIETIRDRYFGDRTIHLVEVKINEAALQSVGAAFLTPIELLQAVENLDEVRAAVEPMDILYVNGGGYLNSLWASPHRLGRLAQILAPALVATSLAKPVVFTANGYGPFRGDTEFFASIFGALRTAKFGMRDTILSPHWLNQVGVLPGQAHHLPDDLLFIDERLKSQGAALGEQASPYIVMETYLPVEFLAKHIHEFRVFVHKMTEELGVRVLFVPFHIGHGGVDQGQFLRRQIPELEIYNIEGNGFLPIEEAVDLIANAELVISSRYHAVILALGQGTPFMSVLKDVLGDKQYYYGKNVGALDAVLAGEPRDYRDYFATNYLQGLATVASEFEALVGRQRDTFAVASARNLPSLRAARTNFFSQRGAGA